MISESPKGVTLISALSRTVPCHTAVARRSVGCLDGWNDRKEKAREQGLCGVYHVVLSAWNCSYHPGNNTLNSAPAPSAYTAEACDGLC